MSVRSTAIMAIKSLGSPTNPIVVEDNSPSQFGRSPVKILEGEGYRYGEFVSACAYNIHTT